MFNDIWFSILSESLQKKILVEMAKSKNKVIYYLSEQHDPLVEHFLKVIIFKNTTNNLNQWVNTIANILNICNGFVVKSNNGKLSAKEYKKWVFGYDGKLDITIVENMVKWFKSKFGKAFPKFTITDGLIQDVFIKFEMISNYFSNYMSKDSGDDENDSSRLTEFREKIIDILQL